MTSNYFTLVLNKMKEQIKYDLTVGRTDEKLEPFTENQIDDFICKMREKLEKIVNKMLEDFQEEDELETLYNAEKDWFCEYLYDVELSGLDTDYYLTI